jgi:Arc/MetJ-type ribon-helix-helix transcriptional regulator
MNVAVRQDLQKFIDAKVESGACASPDEVVEMALERWKVEEEIDAATLNRLVAEGQAEADQGKCFDSDQLFEKIKSESARRRSGRQLRGHRLLSNQPTEV